MTCRNRSVSHFRFHFVVLSALPLESLVPDLHCSYNYELQVHTHRGDRSTKELNFKITARVDLNVIDRHSEYIDEPVYVVRLRLRQLRIVRSNNGRLIKHAVDENIENKLSKPFFFLRDAKGRIPQVFYPRQEQPDVTGLKKGVVSALNVRLDSDEHVMTYEAEEEDDSGIHVTYYNVSRINSTHVDLTKKWTGDDYKRHADGRPVDGKQHSKSHYHSTVKIEHNTIKTVTRTHWSHFNNDKPYNRARNHKAFQSQPDFDIKASGQSQLHLIRCSKPLNSKKLTKRSVQSENVALALANLKRDSLIFGDMHRLKWFSEGTANKTIRSVYELIRCHWDSSVTESELAKCINEFHAQARNHDETFRNIVDLTLERSHQNLSSWSALVGSLVVRGDYHTQKILAKVLLSEVPRRLTEKEYSVLLEAVYFVPPGPLYQDLVQALISLQHRHRNKSEEVSAMAMLVVSGLVKKCREAGYNNSLSDIVMEHLQNSFNNHPARYHDEESDTHEAYLRHHLWAFGNLGHPSALETIARHLNHDNSAIRYSAVLALRKLPSQYTDHHLLQVLKQDEHAAVKTGVIEVFIERQQNITEELRGAIEDAMWKSSEGDELDMAITELLENNGDSSYHPIKLMRSKREAIRRRKRALIPALKPREFALGVKKQWRKSIGGSRAGSEMAMRFINQVKLKIGIFGGSFEVDLNNAAEFNAHVFSWSFNVLKGKATFAMSARFKNDIPKDLIHTIADTADDILLNVDALTSIFTKHLQNFINKLKHFLPLGANEFLEFIAETFEFLKRAIQSTRFGRFFSQIVKKLNEALQRQGDWSRIGNLANQLLENLASLKTSNKPFEGAFEFLNKLVNLVLSVGFELPRGLPVHFNIKEFLKHTTGPFPSVSTAADKYFKALGVKVPRNLFEMLHFNSSLRYPVFLDQFNVISLRLLKFGNNFLRMLDVFGNMARIDFPRLQLPEFAIAPIPYQSFDFDLSFDWRIRFNFKVDFTDQKFGEFKRLFTYLAVIFQKLDGPNVNLDTFFQEFLPRMRNDLKATNIDLFKNTTGFNVARWLRAVIQEFKNVLNQQDKSLLDFSDTSRFSEEVTKNSNVFSKTSLKKVCEFQGFMLKASEELESFGETLEDETIVAVKRIEKETKTVIGEVVNVTVFLDNLVDTLKRNLSRTAKEFVDNFLSKLEGSLGNVKQLADNMAEFSGNASQQLTRGFCHRAADLSGEVLDEIQAEAQNAVHELVSFITSHSSGITNLVSKFKTTLTNAEKWHEKNLEKRLGKFASVAQTLDELLSLLKNENEFWKKVHDISAIVNDVVAHLRNLPEYLQMAREAADKVTDFATDANRWKTEINKLNLRKHFKLDFDDQLRKLCDEFQTLAQDSIKKIQGDELFKTFGQFVTKETDALIYRTVGKLDLLKVPVERVRKRLQEVTDSVDEVGAVLTELRPFSENFSPILREVGQLPNCSEIKATFGDVVNRCSKSAKAFGKQAYGDYVNLQSDIGAFLELTPVDEWESLSERKCIRGGTCLSESFTKQAQGISSKIKKLRKRFESKELFESLEPCKDSVERVALVVNKLRNISKLVEQFALKDDIKKINDLARRITGRFAGDEDTESRVQKRSLIGGVVKKVKKLADHVKLATETKDMMRKLVEEVFEKLKNIRRDDIEPFQENLKGVQQSLGLSFELMKKSGIINPRLRAVATAVVGMNDFANVARNIVNPLEGTILDVLSKTSAFSDVFDDKLKNYGDKVKKTSDEVNGFLDKLTTFLNTIQLRQKGLDIHDYKPWDQYSYCSQEICLRSIRRSSKLYLNIAFLWKYPHLTDLSSVSKTGKWLLPGLFDDYKVRSVAQLSGNEMLLGMRGVASNTDKASLLVVVDTSSKISRVLKILQLQQNGEPFTGDMGGVVVLKSTYIWMSSGESLYAVLLSDVRSSMSTHVPSLLNVVKTKKLSHQATSVSYDDRDRMIWVVDSAQFKAHSYKVAPFGDILSQNDTLETGQHTRGLTIVRQFGVKYACVAKCALIAGYQCKLEFHNVKTGILDESSLHRVVRTPTGLESVQTVDSEAVVTTFSSGTFSEKDKIERIAGDFEDRFFKFKLPILTTSFSVTENCIFLKVGQDLIIPARRLFPLSAVKCGSRRKRNAMERAMDDDVYTHELEKHKRVRRQATESVSCVWNHEGDPMRGTHAFFPKVSLAISVFGISVSLFFGVNGHYYANYRLSLCLRDKQVKLALIPGAWMSVRAGASLSIFVVEAGVTVEATLLETYLVPDIMVRIDKWPLNACVELKMQMTPLSIRVYLWYRFAFCCKVDIGWFYIRIHSCWCSKNTFAEWSWSQRAIYGTLFSDCKKEIDTTRPGVGVCSAKQVGNKKYYVQWRGFPEDTRIQHYTVTIGSIKGSGDDHYSVHGERQSLLVSDLAIMHGRSVHAAVYASNGAGLKSPVAECPEFTAKRRSPVVTFINDGESARDIDYQTDPTSVAMNYGLEEGFSEIASIQWGISSSSKCTLAAAEADELSLRDVGESLSIKKTGMTLANGRKYYTRVVVINHLGLATVACSNGVVVDTTPPLPRGFSIGKDGSTFLPSLKMVSGKFQDFVDNESPVVRYEWKLVDQDTGVHIFNFKMIPLTQKSPLRDGLSLIAGKRYTAVLKGINAAGLYGEVNVTGIIPDETVPVCEGPVDDVINFEDDQDKDFVRQLGNLTARFACSDQDSGIQSTEAAVGTYPGGENIHSFVNVDELQAHVSRDSKTTWIAFTNVTLTSLVNYYVTVKVQNNAGLTKVLSSDGILVDTTGPTVLPSYIRDGYGGTDKKFSKGNVAFPAHWENAFADAESGIGEYYVGLGTTPGLDDQSEFKSYGLSTQTVISGSALESGVTYYVTVIACNQVHVCVNGSSNGAKVDFIPPHAGLVIAGNEGPPIEVTCINKAAWARWQWCPADKAESHEFTTDTCNTSSFYDKHSGIKQFGIAVFSYDTAKLLTPVKTVGRVVVSGRHVVMPNGVFSVVVEAEDRAGIRVSSTSKSFIVDTTPPRVVRLQHGNQYETLMFTRTSYHVFTAYIELTEDVSDIITYSVGVGSYQGGNDIIPLRAHRPRVQSGSLRANWTANAAINLVNGWKYYIILKGTNSAGLFVVTASEPLIFDDEKPIGGHVLDGWATQDTRYHSFPTIYRMHWREFTDVSGIRESKVCLSSSQNDNNCDIHPKIVISNKALSHSFTNIRLQSGMHCYALLQLRDNAGNLGNYWSNGALIDTSPPTVGKVRDGQRGENRHHQHETNILHASWSGFSENETSIHHYELAFGTRENTSDVQPFTNVGLVTTAASSNLLIPELRNGVVYYALVVAYNPLGMRSKVATSSGILVDSSPPSFASPVSDGATPGTDTDYSKDGTSLSVNWKCVDNDSGLSQVFVGFGTQPGIQDVAPFRPVLPYQTLSTLKNVTLSQGFRYFATVKCTNKVGLQVSAFSDGLTFDATPPTLRFVHDGLDTHHDASYASLASFVSANWKFLDPESHVTSHYVSMKYLANGTTAVGPRYVAGSETSVKLHLQDQLKHGEHYFFTITASNGAGLNTTGNSNGFVVDATAPVCYSVYDATVSGTATNFVGHTTKLAVHFKCGDQETGISQFQFAIKDVPRAQYVLPFQKIKGVSSSSSLAVVDGSGKRVLKLRNGGRYVVGIRVTNMVNLTKDYWTQGVTIDLTPPVFRKVYVLFDVRSEAINVTWELSDGESRINTVSYALNTSPDVENPGNFTEVSKDTVELSISETTFEFGQAYYVYLNATNMAGLSTLFVSDGVLVDRTSPSAGRVLADFVIPVNYDGNPNIAENASFATKWSGFVDQESGIRSYKWAIGLSKEATKGRGDESYTSISFTGTINGYVIKNQTVYTNSTYYVCIRVTNSVGLTITNCSEGVFVKLGKLSAGVVYDGPLVKDIDFQLDDKAVWLHWNRFEDPVYQLKNYEWCYGLVNNADHMNCTTPFTAVNPPLKTSTHKFHNVSLAHGWRYSVQVRAFNRQGENTSAISDGFTVDRTPPLAGLISASSSQSDHTIYLPVLLPPTVTWSMREPESVIKEFILSVGSLPGQDDLLPYTKLDGKQRSVNLDELNFTLNDGMSFFITVIGKNILGLEHRITSPLVIVDSTPPYPGQVRDGNGTRDVDFQADNSHVFAMWSEFRDPESDVVEYKYCIGTRPDFCNVCNLTSVDLTRRVERVVHLEHGVTYFVTVTAINRAGLSSTASSNGVTIDTTPPYIQGFSLDSIVLSETETTGAIPLDTSGFSTDPWTVAASWVALGDDVSDVKKVLFCAGSGDKSCDLIPWTELDPHVASLRQTLARPLPSGTIYAVGIKVENGAGLQTIVYSTTMMVDYTPPLPGSVRIAGELQLAFLQEDQPFVASWQESKDPESGVHRYEWKICLSSQMSECATPFVSVAKKTSLLVNNAPLEHGKQYVLIVKSINNAGLEVEAESNPVILDKTPPEAGIVFGGNIDSSDGVFQSSASEISVNWKGFRDKESGISRYSVCVGSRRGICDVRPYKNIPTQPVTVENLNLTHNTTYFVSILAENGAGQTSFASSDGITIDLTVPVGGELRDGEGNDVNVTMYDSFVSGNWDEFSDPESSVSKYVICAGSAKGGCDILPLTDVTGRFLLHLQVWPSIASGTTVFLTLRVYNGGGGVSLVHSDGVLVDSWTPDVGKVIISSPSKTVGDIRYLTSKSPFCASWSGFNEITTSVHRFYYNLCLARNANHCPIRLDLHNRTSVCIEDPPFVEGVKYFVKIQATNQVGLSSSGESPRFLVDTTEPDVGEVTVLNPLGEKFAFVSSELLAQWKGFVDLETAIAEYFTCVGTEPGLCDAAQLVSAGNMSRYSWAALNLTHNGEYFVSLKAINYAGLSSNFSFSDPISVDKTAPNPQLVRDGYDISKDFTYQQSRTHVAATWLTVEDPESDVIILTWCVGTRRTLCDLKPPKSLEILATNASAFLNQPMGLGDKYYVTLMATNGAGLTTTMVSDGVVVDYTPPTAGVVIDGYDGNIDFLRDGETVYATWTGFEDVESGVQFYEFALCETQNVTNCPFPFLNMKQETNISLSGLVLTSGMEYIAIVRATNMVGLISIESQSNGFVFDSSEPVTGNIWIDNQGLTWHNNISARWSDFEDAESGISLYKICVRKSENNCSENDFKNVGEATTYAITSLDTKHSGIYYVVVKAINNAGMSSREVSEVIRIDATPPLPSDESIRELSKDLDENCISGANQTCREPSNADLDVKSSQIRISCMYDFIEARWPRYDDEESGIAKLEWCAETLRNTCNLRHWESIDPHAQNVSAVIPSLPTFPNVRLSIRITNAVGNSVVLNSPSCYSKKSFPPTVEVKEIRNLNDTETDIDYQTDLDAIFVSWTNNATIYPHTQVTLAATRLNSEESTQFLDVPHGKNHVVFTQGVTLKPYTKYHAIVRIWDDFGLYSDSMSNGVIIVPDHPLAIEVNVTDKLLVNGTERWQKYLNVSYLVGNNQIDGAYYMPDPFSTQVKLALENTHANNMSGLEARLKRESAPILYKATVHRVTAGSNEVSNATDASRIAYDQSHVFNSFDTCCSRTNAFSRTILPDKQLKPVTETANFGNSIATLSDKLFVVSSMDSIYVFPTVTETLSEKPVIFRKFNSDGKRANFVNIKTARNNQLLISGNGRVFLFDVNAKYPAESILQIVISNCNHTMLAEGDHCVANDTSSWSSSEDVGRALAYDGSRAIAVGGFVDHSNSGVVAVFDNQSSWQLRQVLGHEKNDSSFGRAIAINEEFLVVLGGRLSALSLYSKTVANSWKEEKNTSEALFKIIPHPANVYLTEENELFVVSTRNLYLYVFQLAVTSNEVTVKCRHSFSNEIQLSGNLDITKTKPVVVAVGTMVEGSDGVELIAYDPNEGCAEIGSVVMEPELRLDDGVAHASVALLGNYLVIGTPQLPTWHSDYERSGSGRVYLATFCPQNSVRRRSTKFPGAGEVVCVSCGPGKKAYAGFEESCVDCSNNVCLDEPSLNFKISRCERNGCSIDAATRAVFQNSSSDNLTVSETISVSAGDGFYRSGSEQSYFVRISQLSASGLETTSNSVLFSIDNTSPEPGHVYDGAGSDESHNCSANTTFGSEHQCSSRSFADTDIDFTNNTAEITARWIDFRDNESDIQSYLWCIGSSPLSDDIMKCENATSRPNGTLAAGLSLQHGSKYYVTVLACNYAGLCTAKSSDGVLVDTTPPEIQYVNDGLLGEDIDMQVFTNVLFGNWAATDLESDVVSYEVGWGSSPGLDDISEFQEIGKVTTWYAKIKDGGLVKGGRYYATVRAINGAGLESKRQFSDGIVVGKTEFLFSANESGLFFFDTVNINRDDGLMEDSKVGDTFGSLKIPKGAVKNGKIKFRCFSLTDAEMKKGSVYNLSLVDPETVRPSKQFKLGNYSFEITAYDSANNTVRSGYRFDKPVVITLFYDVNRMLKSNKKVVSKEVTKEDINPVLLLWDTKNQTWFDASKTCPEPWSHVNRSAKILEVRVCHLTQFALFWTFEAENGIIEFQRDNNGQLSHATYEENSTVVYTHERYQNEIIFDLVRRKGSTGTVNVTWMTTIQSNTSNSLIISPSSGQLEFLEGQWNSSIALKFLAMPEDGPGSTLHVTLVNVSGGAKLGNFNAVKIISFPARIPEVGSRRISKNLMISIPVALLVFLALFAIGIYCIVKRYKRKKGNYQLFPPLEEEFEMGDGFVNELFGLEEEFEEEDHITKEIETTS